MKLMGVDVGFAQTHETTGIACLDGSRLCLARAGTSWDRRRRRIPDGFQPDLIAIDGPLLPQGTSELVRRKCEFMFIRAPFSRQCKPGLSHYGFGLDLRQAAAAACAQFSEILESQRRQNASVRFGGPIVEAFPNAFLAVLLPEETFKNQPKLRRGKRFDWLYEHAVGDERLLSKLQGSVDLPPQLWQRLRKERDHELRAALVCLLTAALAARGKAYPVGDDEGGWFWLPPQHLWQEWAREGLCKIERDVDLKFGRL